MVSNTITEPSGVVQVPMRSVPQRISGAGGNDRVSVRVRSTRGAATRRGPQSVLAHQAKEAGAAGAYARVAQLRPHFRIALPEKGRGGKHRSNVLDELSIAVPARWGPPGPTGGLISFAGKIQAPAGPSPDKLVLGSRHFLTHLFECPGAQGPCFLQVKRCLAQRLLQPGDLIVASIDFRALQASQPTGQERPPPGRQRRGIDLQLSRERIESPHTLAISRTAEV